MRTFKKFLALVLALLMLVGTGVGVVSSSASAVEGDYTYAINYLTALGVLKGYGDGNNGANDNIQRYQMALLLARAYTGETDDTMWKSGESSFTDLDGYAGDVAGAIAFVEGMGIVNGYGNGKFGPTDGIRYQDAIVMLIRALGYEEEGMVYPYSYIQKAIKLKLLAGVSGVGYGDTLTRGVTAQLIYNTLETKIAGTTGKAEDGNSFLSANFKTEDKQMILVATQNVKDEIENLNANYTVPEKDGSVVFQNALTGEIMSLKATEAVVNVPAGHSIDEFVGYAFTVVYSDGKVVGAELNSYKEYENLGKNVVTFKAASYNGNNVKDYSLLLVGDTTYQLVDELTDEEDSNYPQLVVYNYTNDADNILAPMGTNLTAFYGAGNTQMNTMYNYGKLTLIDTDADGVADKGIYKAYNMGIYGIKVAVDAANDNASTEFAMIQNYKDNELGWHFIANYDDVALTDAQYKNQKYVVNAVSGKNPYANSVLDNLTVTGTANNGDVVIYDYNAITNTLHFVLNGAVKTGRLTQQSTYFVTIDKALYYIGTYGYATGMPTAWSGDFIFSGYYQNGTNPKNLYSATINSAFNNFANIGENDANVKYAIIQGTIAYLDSYSATAETANEDYPFVVIDKTWAGNYDANKGEYTISLDENNNILVYALTENGGKPEQIKVSKIVTTAGVTSGKLADAKTVYGLLETSFGQTSFKNQATGDIKDVTPANLAELFSNNVFTVVSVNDKGEYVLNLDLNYAENKSAVKRLTVGGTDATAAKRLQLRNGISGIALVTSDELADYGFVNGRLFLDENSTIVLIGADGVITYNGIPENVTFINLQSGDVLYNVENDLLVIETASNVIADDTTYYGVDADGDFTTTADTKYGTWTGVGAGLVADKNTTVFVAVNGAGYYDTAYIGNDDDGNAVFEHTYNGMLNLATLTVETATIKTNSATAPVTLDKACVVTVKTENDGTTTVTKYAADNTNALYAVACALGYNFGYITEVGDTMALHIDGDDAIEARVGVTNKDVLHGAAETALFGGYKLHTVYKNANGNYVYEVVTSDEQNNVFDASTSYACAYLYDEATDSVNAYVIVK